MDMNNTKQQGKSPRTVYSEFTIITSLHTWL